MPATPGFNVKRDFLSLDVPARVGVIGLAIAGVGSLLLLIAGRWWSGAVGIVAAFVAVYTVLRSARRDPPA